MDVQSVNEVDGWIEKLYNCKPLSEQEIKRLCEKVRLQGIQSPSKLEWERLSRAERAQAPP
jgi:hypothetical protein